MRSRDLVWDVRDYSRAARAYLAVENVDKNSVYEQRAFNWGDPGTETGHTLGTDNSDITIQNDGSGDVNKFLRFEVAQTETSADLLRSQSFRLKYQVDGGGYATMPTSSGNPVYISDHASITDGGDTTDRMTTTTTNFYGTGNASIVDTSSDSAVITFTQNPGAEENIELLYSVTFEDASLSAGNVVDFRVVFGAGGDTTADTALDTYTITDATATWAATPGTGANLLTLLGVG